MAIVCAPEGRLWRAIFSSVCPQSASTADSQAAGRGNVVARAFHRFTETANRSMSLFLRNSGRKTASHFSWNCSRPLANEL